MLLDRSMYNRYLEACNAYTTKGEEREEIGKHANLWVVAWVTEESVKELEREGRKGRKIVVYEKEKGEKRGKVTVWEKSYTQE